MRYIKKKGKEKKNIATTQGLSLAYPWVMTIQIPLQYIRRRNDVLPLNGIPFFKAKIPHDQ